MEEERQSRKQRGWGTWERGVGVLERGWGTWERGVGVLERGWGTRERGRICDLEVGWRKSVRVESRGGTYMLVARTYLFHTVFQDGVASHVRRYGNLLNKYRKGPDMQVLVRAA